MMDLTMHWVVIGVCIGIGLMLAPLLVRLAWVALLLIVFFVVPFIGFEMTKQTQDPNWLWLMIPWALMWIYHLYTKHFGEKPQ